VAFELPFAVVAYVAVLAFAAPLSAVLAFAALLSAVLAVAPGGEVDPAALAVVAAGFAAAQYSAAPPVDGRWLPAGFQAGWHWDCLPSDYLEPQWADGSDSRWTDGSDSRCSQRWNSADWHSVDSRLAGSDSVGSGSAGWHLHWVVQPRVDSADLAGQCVHCFDFAPAGRAAQGDLQNCPSEEVPPFSRELRPLRWRWWAVVDWREPVSSPLDGHR